MGKIKEKTLNAFKILKKSVEKFPLTIGTILILTLIFTINFDNDFLKAKVMGNIFLFAVLFASGSFLIETLLENKNKKIYLYILSAILSGILTYAINIEQDVLWMTNNIFLFRIVRVIVCYVLTVGILGIYYNYKKSGKSFEEYLTKVFVNIFKTSIIYGILAIGLALVSAVFVYLILGGKGYTLILRIEILLLGIYYGPMLIYSFSDTSEEVGKFAKIVIKYVLGILVIVAFAIIYLYMLKLLILRSMPSNQIFRILATLFVLGLPIWTMCSYFKDEKLFDKINQKLPLLFIPFIFLQIYTIGIRVASNGITEPRYLCLMLVLFEIIYIAMYLKNKEKIGNALIVFMAFVIISSVVPYVNMFTVSNLSQNYNLKIYTRKTDLSDKDIIKISGAYEYLDSSIEGDKYITKEDKEFIRDELKNKDVNNVLEEKGKISSQEYIYARKGIDAIDVAGYKTLYEISSNKNYLDDKIKKDDLKNIKFETNSGYIINADLSLKIQEYIENEKNIDDYFEENNEIILDENRKIILESFSAEYDKLTEEIDYYNISGYLLEK